MNSLKSISAALSSVNEKKLDLQKAFEDLQPHFSELSSFNVQWKDIEDYFDSIWKSAKEQLKDLESKEKQATNNLSQKIFPSEIEKSPAESPLKKSEELQVISRPKLKSLCENMDGMGLLSYVVEHHGKKLSTVRPEITVAFQSASDPAKIVLDAMQGLTLSKSKANKDNENYPHIRTCILFLKQLASMSPLIKPQVKEKAMKLAVEWKRKLDIGCEIPYVTDAFLQLLRTYDLVSAFSTDELLDLVTTIPPVKQAVDLFRLLNIPDKAPDLIKKFISKGKKLEAVEFAYAFELTDKFPPVPLLEQYVTECRDDRREIRRKRKGSVDAQNVIIQELSALKAVLKCIVEHKLLAQYPRESLDTRVKELNQKLESIHERNRERKRLDAIAGQQRWQNTGNKRTRPNVPVPPLAQAPLLQPEFISNQFNPYFVSSAGLYGLGHPPPLAASYITGYGSGPQYGPPYYQ